MEKRNYFGLSAFIVALSLIYVPTEYCGVVKASKMCVPRSHEWIFDLGFNTGVNVTSLLPQVGAAIAFSVAGYFFLVKK